MNKYNDLNKLELYISKASFTEKILIVTAVIWFIGISIGIIEYFGG